jgi:hypothetical protein
MVLVHDIGYDAASHRLDYPITFSQFTRVSAFFPSIEDLIAKGQPPFPPSVLYAIAIKTVQPELIAWLREQKRYTIYGRYGFSRRAVRIDRYRDGVVIVFDDDRRALYCRMRWG